MMLLEHGDATALMPLNRALEGLMKAGAKALIIHSHRLLQSDWTPIGRESLVLNDQSSLLSFVRDERRQHGPI
jgi:hypothetical protein